MVIIWPLKHKIKPIRFTSMSYKSMDSPPPLHLQIIPVSAKTGIVFISIFLNLLWTLMTSWRRTFLFLVAMSASPYLLVIQWQNPKIQLIVNNKFVIITYQVCHFGFSAISDVFKITFSLTPTTVDCSSGSPKIIIKKTNISFLLPRVLSTHPDSLVWFAEFWRYLPQRCLLSI